MLNVHSLAFSSLSIYQFPTRFLPIVNKVNSITLKTLIVQTEPGTAFLTAGIQTNAIVYNTTAQIAYYITDVTDDLNIALSPATTGGAADAYVIYNAATIGCILYVGTAGNATVLMADQNGLGGSEITFTNLPNASFLPTQVIRVAATTTASDIIALW